VWAWPLCLPISSNSVGSSSGLAAPSNTTSSSSGAESGWYPVLPAAAPPAGAAAITAGAELPPVVAVHGLSGSACRIVVTSGPGDVLADCHCQLQDGIARCVADLFGTSSCCS
jgi:hypothetical protein